MKAKDRSPALDYKIPVEEAPCKQACPAGIDVPRYVRLIAEGRFAESLAVVCEKIPFPSVCGRVCFHPCEDACQAHYNHLGAPVAVNTLKRFVTEQVLAPQQSPVAKSSGKRVAIVGSGPAGLTAAYYLTKLGHRVTVLEALPVVGGMMRVGIPEHRLPREVLDKEIDEIKSIGFEIKTNAKVDSLDELLGQGYDAVLLALGAHRGIRLMIEGEDSPGVVEGVTLLRDVRLGRKVNFGDRVAVIGGGNVAVDSARTALRLGGKEVTIIYRRSRTEMPANPEEVRAALYEGVKITFLAAPQRISRENGKLSLSCIHMKLGEPDDSGRPRPIPIKGSEFSMDFDSIIPAIGETPDIPSQFNLKTGRGNTVQVNSDTLATSRQGVFASGDVVTGPVSVIEAIAAGRRAASSIDRYLGGTGNIDETLSPPEEEVKPLQSPLPVPVGIGRRAVVPSLPIEQRLGGFAEVELPLTEAVAVEQAERCLRCDLPIVVDVAKCNGCLLCQLRCSLRFEKVVQPSKSAIKILGTKGQGNQSAFEISFTDRCDACGLCVKYCPTGALTRQKCKETLVGNVSSERRRQETK